MLPATGDFFHVASRVIAAITVSPAPAAVACHPATSQELPIYI